MIGNTGARERLIDTTRGLLWERGYAATSPRAILDKAGVGQGSMYHHFTGKEQLATEALAVTARELLEQAEAILSGDGSAFDRIGGYLRRQRDVLRGCPVGRMAGDADVLDTPALHDVVAATFESIRELVREAAQQGIRDGDLSARLDPLELADTVLAVVQGGYVLARAAADPAPFDRATAGALALLELTRAEARP